MLATLIGVLGVLVTITIFLATAIFQLGRQSGHHGARLEALEAWRGTIRQDMHEISDNLKSVGEELQRLSTLIEERTERRQEDRTRK